jgi:outer membrane protein assembly factor BamB
MDNSIKIIFMLKKLKRINFVFPVLSFIAGSVLVIILWSCNGNATAQKFDKIKNSNSILALAKFIDENPSADQTAEAIKLRNKLIYDSISKINSVKEYKKFVKYFPGAEQAEAAKKKIKELSGTHIVISTFRGNFQRNYYGDKCPSRLDEIWTLNLGSGQSFAYGKMYTWTGAGWTGQPLVVEEDSSKTFLIQGAFDYNVRKINAKTGKVVWKYKFDDVIKGTGTIWVNPKPDKPENAVVIMQGSRRGEVLPNPNVRPSFREISYFTGKELWKLDVVETPSYSRDCDGSALVYNDTAYIGLENGKFVVFNPDHQFAAEKTGIIQPKIYQDFNMWEEPDIQKHHNNLVNESSLTQLNGKVYLTGGSGRVYGYNLKTRKFDWEFYVGPDLDCSAPVTHDSCLLVNCKPVYGAKVGGVFKLDPSKDPKEAAQWFFPVGNKKFAFWDGGIIGTVAVNDKYVKETDQHIAAFLAIDGNLYVVDQNKLSGEKCTGPDGVTTYPEPKLLFKKYVGASISSPIIVGNKLVACTYEGIYLFEFDKDMNFKLLEQKKGISFEASPICWNNRIYVVSNTTGLMYCFGEK